MEVDDQGALGILMVLWRRKQMGALSTAGPDLVPRLLPESGIPRTKLLNREHRADRHNCRPRGAPILCCQVATLGHDDDVALVEPDLQIGIF